ncbi:trafficking protein particle complex subunit 11 [Patella vulgata]|uniref:trafficking protein particle complex subunit 11 n=1 Tax=Patella vulgata TaxID=6465 RepID=UPI0024A857DD|nr:trafficking protein particle complex subunit 11 [Patella vulgata]
MSWANELPSELLCRPTGLVVLTGLDITYNAIHKSIWDSFCNNRRSDRVPLKFNVMEADHVYPKSKSKRTSYQWYIPKGILKRSWMKKHLNEVPAVVVVFFDLDWDENLWKEKQMECATRVEIVRNSLQGQGTKVSVVLIQKNTPLPPGEDLIASERAASLCSMCDISAKSLYVLPHTDHLIGYTIRLENAFYEQSQSYYHTEARKVKSHKDFLNKTTHQLLYVRHQFKIAFFNELKQDTHTSLKHYKQAYGYMLDLRMYDTNMLEIKTMAGFLNYKLCRLSFQHNTPLDAIAQFRKHIDFFKSRTGTPELAFENSAWMSKQFQVFGDLFDEAIKLGLTALQTQHPGFYYQQAANHSITRKQLCQALCTHTGDLPQNTVLDGLDNLEYFGQRPWRQGHQSIDPPDAQKERDGIIALQIREKQEDHCWIIIPLLSSAVAQFKKYKSPRMKRHLMVQMGEEYFHAKDYGKALMLLNKVMWDYRTERWSPILTSILNLSLKCAYLTARIQDYISTCMELIGQYSQCSIEDKSRIEKNIFKVMSNELPDPEPGLEQTAVESAKTQWLTAKSSPNLFTIEMSTLVSFIECKARFIGDTTSADSKVKLEVCLRVSCPQPIRFSKLSVLFNNQIHNSKCEMSDGRGITAASSPLEADGADLYLLPGKPRTYSFSFLPSAEDVGRQIEISSVALELGNSDNGCCAVLRWVGTGADASGSTSNTMFKQPITPFSVTPAKTTDIEKWLQFKTNPVIKVVSRKAKLDMTLIHQAPSLLNEFYQVQIVIQNKEDSKITDVSLYIALQNEEEYPQDPGAHISIDKASFNGKMQVNEELVLPDLEPGQKLEKCFFMKCFQPGARSILTKVKYTVSVTVGIQSLTCFIVII